MGQIQLVLNVAWLVSGYDSSLCCPDAIRIINHYVSFFLKCSRFYPILGRGYLYLRMFLIVSWQRKYLEWVIIITSFNIFLNYNVLASFAYTILWAWDVFLPLSLPPKILLIVQGLTQMPLAHGTVPNSPSVLTRLSSLLPGMPLLSSLGICDDHFALCFSYSFVSVYLT